MDWALSVASSRHVDGWLGEARRLRALLDAVSNSLRTEFDTPLSWYNSDTTAGLWDDMPALAGYLESEQLRNETGEIVVGGGANSIVQAYLVDSAKGVIGGTFSVGLDGPLGISVVLRFRRAPQLREHSLEWLAGFLNAACLSIEADTAIIAFNRLTDKLVVANPKHLLGALTLVPRKIDLAVLPDSLTTCPGPTYLPDGVIVAVKDLHLLTDNPASLVDDLLRLDDLISAADSS